MIRAAAMGGPATRAAGRRPLARTAGSGGAAAAVTMGVTAAAAPQAPWAHAARVGDRAHVLAIATEYRQESVILQKCAELLGYHFQLVGFGKKWVGFGTKLVRYDEALRHGLGSCQIDPNDPVMLIDAWDCALLGPATEFLQKMKSRQYAECGVPWYAGERIIGPDFFKANR